MFNPFRNEAEVIKPTSPEEELQILQSDSFLSTLQKTLDDYLSNQYYLLYGKVFPISILNLEKDTVFTAFKKNMFWIHSITRNNPIGKKTSASLLKKEGKLLCRFIDLAYEKITEKNLSEQTKKMISISLSASLKTFIESITPETIESMLLLELYLSKNNYQNQGHRITADTGRYNYYLTRKDYTNSDQHLTPKQAELFSNQKNQFLKDQNKIWKAQETKIRDKWQHNTRSFLWQAEKMDLKIVLLLAILLAYSVNQENIKVQASTFLLVFCSFYAIVIATGVFAKRTPDIKLLGSVDELNEKKNADDMIIFNLISRCMNIAMKATINNQNKSLPKKEREIKIEEIKKSKEELKIEEMNESKEELKVEENEPKEKKKIQKTSLTDKENDALNKTPDHVLLTQISDMFKLTKHKTKLPIMQTERVKTQPLKKKDLIKQENSLRMQEKKENEIELTLSLDQQKKGCLLVDGETNVFLNCKDNEDVLKMIRTANRFNLETGVINGSIPERGHFGGMKFRSKQQTWVFKGHDGVRLLFRKSSAQNTTIPAEQWEFIKEEKKIDKKKS